MSLATIDNLRGQLDELLRIALEVIKTLAVDQNPVDTAPGELCPVLQLGEQIRQFDIGLFQSDSRRSGNLGRLNASLADGNVSLAPLQTSPGNAWRLPQLNDRAFQQGFIIEGYTICSLVLDAVPQRLELRTIEHSLTWTRHFTLIRIPDLQTPAEFPQHGNDLHTMRDKFFRQDKGVIPHRLSKRILYPTSDINIPFQLQMVENYPRFVVTEDCRFSALTTRRNLRELMRLNDTKADSGILLDLALQVLGKLFIALPRHHRQRIHLKAAQALPALIDAKTQPAPDSLPPFPLGANIAQSANLEHIRVIPSLAQRRMGENEPERLVETQQLLLIPHDEIVCAFGIITINLGILGCVHPSAFPVYREITVMNHLGGSRQARFPEQRAVIRVSREPLVLLLEHLRIIALDCMTVLIIPAVPLHAIDEEQAEVP